MVKRSYNNISFVIQRSPNINRWTCCFGQIGVVLKCVSLKYVSLQFFQPISYAYIFPCVFMKTVIKDPLLAILGCNDCHTARPEDFILLPLKYFFLACCHLDLLSVCNFLFPVVLCSIRKLQTKTAPIILNGATYRL